MFSYTADYPIGVSFQRSTNYKLLNAVFVAPTSLLSCLFLQWLRFGAALWCSL